MTGHETVALGVRGDAKKMIIHVLDSIYAMAWGESLERGAGYSKGWYKLA